jgi:hypothetical protein
MKHITRTRWMGLLLLAGWMLWGSRAEALILFNLDNTANQTDPGTGVPWDAVGKVTNSVGTAISGTAIYLGNGYVLTANHVTLSSSFNHITFDGVTNFAIDMTYFSGSSSQQVAPNVDLKVMKLTTNPSITPVNLLTTAVENTAASTVIGWGVGRNATPLASGSVGWGTDATSAKRWGLNAVEDGVLIGYQSGSYQGLRTVAGGNDGAGTTYDPDGLGDSEAALTLYDSGSGLFQNLSGTWYLVGVGTGVETLNISTFGDNDVGGAGFGDDAYYVRISSYDTQILSAIPEPGTPFLMGMGLLVAAWLRRRNPVGQARG